MGLGIERKSGKEALALKRVLSADKTLSGSSLVARFGIYPDQIVSASRRPVEVARLGVSIKVFCPASVGRGSVERFFGDEY